MRYQEGHKLSHSIQLPVVNTDAPLIVLFLNNDYRGMSNRVTSFDDTMLFHFFQLALQLSLHFLSLPWPFDKFDDGASRETRTYGRQEVHRSHGLRSKPSSGTKLVNVKPQNGDTHVDGLYIDQLPLPS